MASSDQVAMSVESSPTLLKMGWQESSGSQKGRREVNSRLGNAFPHKIAMAQRLKWTRGGASDRG